METSTKLKRLLLSIAEFSVCYFLYSLVSTAIHEWFHLETLIRLGGQGYIQKTWFGGVCIPTVPPQHHAWLFYLSGGLLTGLFYLALAYWDWIDEDWEEYSALHLCGWPQITYAVFEMLFIDKLSLSQYLVWATVAQLVGLGIALVFVIPAFMRIYACLKLKP